MLVSSIMILVAVVSVICTAAMIVWEVVFAKPVGFLRERSQSQPPRVDPYATRCHLLWDHAGRPGWTIYGPAAALPPGIEVEASTPAHRSVRVRVGRIDAHVEAFGTPMAFAPPLDAAADLADLGGIRDFILGGDNRRALQHQGASCYLFYEHAGRGHGATVYGPASLIVLGAEVVAYCRFRRVDYVQVRSVDEFVMVNNVLMAFGTPALGRSMERPEQPAASHIYVAGSKYKIRPKAPDATVQMPGGRQSP